MKSMALFAYVVVFVLGANSAVPMNGRPIQQAVAQRHGPETRVTSILASGNYAVVRGESGVHDGLRFYAGGWHVVCELGPGPPSINVLKRRCGFPIAAATQLSADEVANAAALQGQFTSAASSERVAYQFAPRPARPSESARLQLLNQLNKQMQIGQITRADAIRKWNELRFSVYLP